jgi:nucleoside 2-deoxyribosyltransferase
MSAKVFISYSHRDKEWTREFADHLQHQGISVWLDEYVLKGGDSVAEAVEKGLRDSDAIVSILGPENVTQPSIYFELGAAIGMGKRVIPVVSNDVDLYKLPLSIRWRKYLLRTSPEETANEVIAALSQSDAPAGN